MERSTDAYQIEVITTVSLEALTSLYNSVGWTAYTQDITKLQKDKTNNKTQKDGSGNHVCLFVSL